MEIEVRLQKIVGEQFVSTKQEDLKRYAEDFSLSPPSLPDIIVWPKDVREVADVVKTCNEYNVPLIPVSSRVHFYGATIPKQGGVVVDLARMSAIHEIDTDNRFARFEPGVTWRDLMEALREKGMRAIMPLCPHALRSVVTDTLEREVPTNVVYDYGEPMQSVEVVWPTGEIFRCGSASVNGFPESKSRGVNPSGPGIDFYRFIQGAQGTFGIVTWMSLKIESIPKIDRIFFCPSNDVSYLIEFLYRILPRRIGQECLILNSLELALLLAEEDRDLPSVQAKLPPWTLVLVISGLVRRPEEKVAYEVGFLKEVIKNEFPKIVLWEDLPGLAGSGRKMVRLLRSAWPEGQTYWKHRMKGRCQSLFFITRPLKVPSFIEIMKDIGAGFNYPQREIGVYIQPIEHNRACQLEFDLFYDPQNEEEKKTIKELYYKAASEMFKQGAFFTRPYGDLAKMVYERAASYTMTLKRLKEVFDPKNVMNPGNLCF
jgi:FAD/FMN-containing dehydrogenase